MAIAMHEGVEAALQGSHIGSGGQVLTLSGSSARSAVLSEGLWKLCATEACWATQGSSSVTAAEHTAPAEFIPAGSVRYFTVTSAAHGYVACIQSDGAGGYASITRADLR
jgi:hypothetical protein